MIEFKLDTQSMDKLFPEGSAARVNLQSSIIASLAKRFIKPSDELQKILEEFKNKAVKEAALNFGITTGDGYYNQYDLSQTAKARLKEEAALAISTQISKTVNCAVEEYMSKIDNIIERRITDQVNDLVRTKVAAKLKEISSNL